MAGGNVIVTKTTNRVTFETDRGSYQRTVDRIKQVGKEWDKVASKMKPLRLKFEENAYTKIRRKQQDAAAKAALAEAKAKAAADAKAAKAQIAAERKIQTIRAKAIRFSTSALQPLTPTLPRPNVLDTSRSLDSLPASITPRLWHCRNITPVCQNFSKPCANKAG